MLKPKEAGPGMAGRVPPRGLGGSVPGSRGEGQQRGRCQRKKDSCMVGILVTLSKINELIEHKINILRITKASFPNF